MRITGVVKWFSNTKGFGFITGVDGEDYFCHFSKIKMPGYRFLREGENVEFEIANKPKGPEAHDVVRLRRREHLTESTQTVQTP
jgi:CspA family cold shock protein